MADRHRIGTFTSGGRFVTTLDLNPGDGTYAPIRDTFQVTPPAQTDVKAKNSRRYGGSKRVAEIHDNGQIAMELYVKGASADATLGLLDAVFSFLEDARTQFYYEFRPDGASRSTYFELRATSWEPMYRWIEFQANFTLHAKIGYEVAPLALGDPLDILDDFSRPDPILLTNLITNPNLEIDTAGYTNSDGYFLTGGSTLTRTTSQAAVGTASLQVVTTAGSASQGAAIALSGNFQGGVTYRTRIRLKGNAGGEPVQAFMGSQANEWGDTGAVTLTNGWQEFVFDWTPSTTRTNVWLAVRTRSAVVSTFFVDAAMVSTSLTGTYFDGDNANAYWTGTRGASTSAQVASNVLSEYTFDTGSGTFALAGNQLLGTSVSEKVFYHSARGYRFTDLQLTLKLVTGASALNTNCSVLKRYDSNTHLMGQVTNGAVAIWKKLAGVYTQLATIAFSPNANTTYWIRFRVEGNVATAELFTSEPTPSGTPAATCSYVLSGTDAAAFGTGAPGDAGIRFSGVDTDFRYDDFRVEPYTYRSRVLPEVIDLRSIPGTAPAKVDLSIGQPSSSPRQIPWGMVGWAQKPSTYNYIWNGSMESNSTDGWVTTLASYLAAGATLTPASIYGAKYGGRALGISVTAVDQGAAFQMYRRFKKGVTYTALVWLKDGSSASGQNVYTRFGTTTDQVSTSGGGFTTLSSSWQLQTLTWTPTVDADYAAFAVQSRQTMTATFAADAIQVFEGTVAPTIGKHPEGTGGHPPFGILQAEGAMPASFTGFSIAASGSYLGGYGITGTAANLAAEWMIDPTLLVNDDFSSEISVEVYARMIVRDTMASAVATLSAIPESNAAQRTYTSEWGSTGKSITLPVSGTGGVWRVVRLGTLTMPVDTSGLSRWRLKLALTFGVASSCDVDYLLLVPARQRALSPTGKTADSTYPNLFHAGGVEELKVIRSDLSGRYASTASITVGLSPLGRDSGMGGQQVEFPPGDVQIIGKLSDIVPDDPTINAAAEASTTTTAMLHAAVTPRYFLTRSV